MKNKQLEKIKKILIEDVNKINSLEDLCYFSNKLKAIWDFSIKTAIKEFNNEK